MMKTIRILVLICLWCSFASAADRTVVMISLDGAKPEYFSAKATPHIYSIVKNGWSGPMQPIFPSITFPNHAALATGCTAERHGIVNNDFVDPVRGKFNMSPDSTWMLCEPVWVSAEKAGVHSAIAMWPMSWTAWNGVRAHEYFPDHAKSVSEAMKTPEKDRIAQIIAWLKLPTSERPGLILAWFGSLDHQAHLHGPNSPEVQKIARQYDQLIGKILTTLRRLPAAKTTDFILVSDHGMSTTKNYISLDYLSARLEKSKIKLKSIDHSGPLTLIYLAKSSQATKAAAILNYTGIVSTEFIAYTQKTLPADWHFRTPRAGQVVLMAREDDVFTKRGKGETLLYTPKNDEEKGNHGYPPETPSMQAIFFAEGPDFPRGKSPTQFKTIEIAPMIRRILSLNNSSLPSS